MPRRLLVVVTTEVEQRVLDAVVRDRGGVEPEVKVVAPAAELSRLEWLANDEDEARASAAERAESTAAAAPTDAVRAEVGDSDPLTAIEDALRTFAADEIVVVTRPDDEASWLEEGSGKEARARFLRPVTHLTVAGDGSLAAVR